MFCRLLAMNVASQPLSISCCILIFKCVLVGPERVHREGELETFLKPGFHIVGMKDNLNMCYSQ